MCVVRFWLPGIATAGNCRFGTGNASGHCSNSGNRGLRQFRLEERGHVLPKGTCMHGEFGEEKGGTDGRRSAKARGARRRLPSWQSAAGSSRLQAPDRAIVRPACRNAQTQAARNKSQPRTAAARLCRRQPPAAQPLVRGRVARGRAAGCGSAAGVARWPHRGTTFPICRERNT